MLGYRAWDVRTTVIKNPISLHREGGQDLINPLLDCDTGINTLPEFTSLKTGIADAIKQGTDRGDADHVSVYFRSLNGGRWVGINEDEQYVGASLIKLPVAMAYYKLAETRPETMEDKIAFDGVEDKMAEITQNIPPDAALQQGKSYSVEDLIYRMLAYSDNASLDLLGNHIEQKSIDDVFDDLGIARKRDDANNALISPKDYSEFFRVLYNTTYYSRGDSQNLLKTLTRATFKDGLVAGVPADVPVAHKFGERTVVQDNGTTSLTELHDCGIIYLPKHPYFLCVMTRGKDLDALKGVIQHISKTTYAGVDAFWRNGGK